MKILLADDDPVTRLKLSVLLARRGYDVVSACDGEEALGAITGADAPDLAILDWMMPRLNGVEVCRAIRASETRYTYVIILTGKSTKDDVVRGLEAGADDYLSKPFDDQELYVRVRAGQRILELQERLRFQAAHDAHTGLMNRGAVLEALRAECDRSRRTRTPFAVILIDIDRFKRINDTHGHAAGDDVLRATALRLQACLRPHDSLGRYGGEEFLAVLPGCDRDDAVALADRLRESVAGRPVPTRSLSIPVTISAGVSVGPQGSDTCESVVQAADVALYGAKRAGRNRVVIAPVPAEA